MIETGYQWGAEEQYEVGTHADAETTPEYGVIVFVPDVFHICQCGTEAAFLQ